MHTSVEPPAGQGPPESHVRLFLLKSVFFVSLGVFAGHPYVGVDFAKGLCGVSVIRSGEAMEAALRECCQGIKIGKILVHR